MATDTNENQITAVRFSGFISLSAAMALGSSISIGLGVYLLIDPIFTLIGTETPAAYLLLIPFFVPVILTLAERAAAIQGNGGLYNLAKITNNIYLIFAVGWLVLGGYILLGVTLAWGGGYYLQIGLARFFGYTFDPVALGALLILLVVIHSLYGTSANWRYRTVTIFLSIIILIFVLTWSVSFPLESIQGYAYIFSGQNLEAIPYLAVGLWGMSFIIDRRQRLRRSGRGLLWPLLFTVLILSLGGAFAANVLVQYPRLIVNNMPPLVALAAAYGPLFELSIILCAVFMTLFGLSQSLVSLVRLSGQMAEDGYLASEFKRIHVQHQYPVYSLLFFASVIGLVLFVAAPVQVVTAASGTLLLAISLVHLPGLFSSKSPLPEKRQYKLPLHPLFPLFTIGICLALALLPPLDNQMLFVVWVIIGVLFYVAFAQRGGIAVRRRSVVFTDEDANAGMLRDRVLVAMYDVENAAALMNTAVAVAQARFTQLLVLQIVVLPEQTTDAHRQEIANAAWQQLRALASDFEASGVSIQPIVRLAPTVADGILSTVWEEKIPTCILGWPLDPHGREDDLDGVVESIVQRASCEVLIPKNALPVKMERILVPMISAAHSPAALAMGQALVEGKKGKVVALGIVREALTPERSSAAYERLHKAISKLESSEKIEPLIEQTTNLKQLISESAENYDLTILGVSDEGFLAQTRFGGMATDIALAISSPIFLVKSKESTSQFGLRRLWDQLFNLLPTLTSGEQAAVYLNMRHSAKAAIDFYVLIMLATAIAYFGLLQDSDAVIIGAMLVAPLMNPILALAHGIVQGNAKIMREAFQTTARGTIFAITLATLATLFLLGIGAPLNSTNAILARTSPGLFDLMVAIVSGMAAAYATSRSDVSGALPGVAIAAALVPPLAVVGYGLGLAQFEIASGALLLFLTNLAAIILAAAIIFLLLGFRPPARMERDEQAKFGLRMAIIALVAVSVPLLLTTFVTRYQADTTATIETIIKKNWLPDEALVTNIEIDNDRSDVVVTVSVLDFTGQIGTAEMVQLQLEISEAINRSVVLQSVISLAELDVIDGTFDYSSLTPTATFTPVPSPNRSEESLNLSVADQTRPFVETPTPIITYSPDTAVVTLTRTLLPEPVETETPTP